MSGDSGAWVIDYVTGELYGHLVASDVFGTGYVIPIDDVFQDIKLRLSLNEVKLPEGCDMLAATTEVEPEIPVDFEISRDEPDVGTPEPDRTATLVRKRWLFRHHPISNFLLPNVSPSITSSGAISPTSSSLNKSGRDPSLSDSGYPSIHSNPKNPRVIRGIQPHPRPQRPPSKR
jgi:hypothetical protein